MSIRLSASTLALLVFAPTSNASPLQDATGADNPIVVSDRCVEAWVNPCHGDDVNGVVSFPDRPFRTIAGAQANLNSSGLLSPTRPGIVHLDAGIYSPSTNGEPMPVEMQDNISIRGLGAKECVIRLTPHCELVRPVHVFYPTKSQPDVTDPCGAFNNSPCSISADGMGPGWWGQRNVVVNTDQLNTSSPQVLDGGYVEFLDNVTLQGGDIQVYIGAELPEEEVVVRVSNCVFDMLDYSSVGSGIAAIDPTWPTDVHGPDFGVLVVNQVLALSIRDCEFEYRQLPCTIVNNTFVMHWNATGADSPAFPLHSKADAVAICDASDPKNEDCDQRIRGISKLNIQNNLIRTSADSTHLPLLGIDAGDTLCVHGLAAATLPASTNAFDDTLYPAGTGYVLDGNCRFAVFRESRPTAVVNPLPSSSSGGGDPAFVGEFVAQTITLQVPFQGFDLVRDWRVLPDSNLRDKGASPAPPANLSSFTTAQPWTLQAANGTQYVDAAFASAPTGEVSLNLPGLAHSAFVFDGEGYGNLRIVSTDSNGDGQPGPGGLFVDVGFDEVSDFIHAGYVNETRAFEVTGLIECNFGLPIPAQARQFTITPSPQGLRVVSDNTPAGITVGSTVDWGYSGGCITAPNCTPPASAVPPAYFAVSSIHFGNTVPVLLPGIPAPLNWLFNGGTCSFAQEVTVSFTNSGSYLPPMETAPPHTGFAFVAEPAPAKHVNGSYFARQVAQVLAPNVLAVKSNSQAFLSKRTRQ